MTDSLHSYCFVLNLRWAVGQFSCSDVGRYFLAAFVFMTNTQLCFIGWCGNCSTLCSKQVLYPKSIQGSPGLYTAQLSAFCSILLSFCTHLCVSAASPCYTWQVRQFWGLLETYGSASLWENNFFSTCVLGCSSFSFSYLVSFGI